MAEEKSVRDESRIAALLRERAGLVQRGLVARVEQVDEQLKHYGHDDKASARRQPPQGRSSKPPQNTD